MASAALARRTPTSALETVEEWAGLSPEARRRRAAEAIQNRDKEALTSLLVAYARTFGRKGTDTSQNTLQSYVLALEALLAWCDEHAKQPHQLTPDDAVRLRAWLCERGSRTGGPLSPASVNARMAGVRAFVGALRWAGLCEGNPFEGVRGVCNPVPPAEQGDVYRPEEVAAMLGVATSARERALLLLLADGGLRAQEVASLTWKGPENRLGVDLDAQTICIEGKGRRRRTIRMTERLRRGLWHWYRESNGVPGGKVFGVTRQRIGMLLARLARKAGVPRRGPHAMRHYCGTELYKVTRDLQIVARHLGHSNIETSARYAHLANVDYERAISALEYGRRSG